MNLRASGLALGCCGALLVGVGCRDSDRRQPDPSPAGVEAKVGSTPAGQALAAQQDAAPRFDPALHSWVVPPYFASGPVGGTREDAAPPRASSREGVGGSGASGDDRPRQHDCVERASSEESPRGDRVRSRGEESARNEDSAEDVDKSPPRDSRRASRQSDRPLTGGYGGSGSGGEAVTPSSSPSTSESTGGSTLTRFGPRELGGASAYINERAPSRAAPTSQGAQQQQQQQAQQQQGGGLGASGGFYGGVRIDPSTGARTIVNGSTPVERFGPYFGPGVLDESTGAPTIPNGTTANGIALPNNTPGAGTTSGPANTNPYGSSYSGPRILGDYFGPGSLDQGTGIPPVGGTNPAGQLTGTIGTTGVGNARLTGAGTTGTTGTTGVGNAPTTGTGNMTFSPGANVSGSSSAGSR